MKNLMRLAAASIAALVVTGAVGQEVTLRVWDSFTEQSEGMDAMVAAFEAEHPNIKIDRDVQAMESLRAVMQTALNSGTGPDVLYYDTGPGYGGTLARNGLLLPLDDLYASGALDAVYPWTRERVTFDGVTYGIGNEVEFVGVYYNRDMFADLGLEAPTTYEEFLAVAQALKQNGVFPVAFGDAPGWPAFHTFSAFTNARVPQDELMSMIEGEASWNDPRIVDAIQAAFVDMGEFYPPSVNAVSYEDANALFQSGMSGMNLTGSWMIRDFKDTDFETGIFFLPAPGGTEPRPPAGLGSGYFVSAKTEHPEEAQAFLSFLFDPANARFWVEEMSVLPPYEVDTTTLEVPGLLEFALAALADVDMGFNIDVLTPDKFNTTMSDGFQAVIGGSRTAEEQAAALQGAMTE